MYFMNVDLEVVSEFALDGFLNSIKGSTYVLHSTVADGRYLATIELLGPMRDNAESALAQFVSIVENIDTIGRAAWEGAHTKVFDIGIQSSARKHQLVERISVATLGRVAALGAELHITVYEPSQDAGMR